MDDITLLGIPGALRAGSTNRKLLREAVRLFAPAAYTEADLRLPLFDEDDEIASGIPEAVARLAAQIAGADAVVISTPEYNKGIPGVLKNALDWVSRTGSNPWKGKPVAVMSAADGRSGGERGQAMLRQCMVGFRPVILQGPEMHLADSRNQFGEDGRLQSARYEKTLQALMDELRATVARYR